MRNSLLQKEIHTVEELMMLIDEVGMLPLLDSAVKGYSAHELVAEECRYVVYPDGGWDWPMWKWKGPIVTEMPCVYGKLFDKKAGFVSTEWWPDLMNYRRARYPLPDEGTTERMILDTLRANGSLITRDLRAACGFDGPKMRSKFDAFVTRLEMGCYIVTEDFVYPRDRHNREYGWGWSLLTTPEYLYKDMPKCSRTSEESYKRILAHLTHVLPNAAEKDIEKMIR